MKIRTIAAYAAATGLALALTSCASAENAQPGEQFYGIQGSNQGRVMIFAGGIPLRRGDAVHHAATTVRPSERAGRRSSRSRSASSRMTVSETPIISSEVNRLAT